MFDVLADLEDAVDKAAAEQSLDVERLCRIADRVEFLRVRAIGAFDRSGEWQADGYLNAAAALRNRCRMTNGTAKAAVELARKLERLEVVAGAFRAGEISRHHAVQITDAYTPPRAAGIVPVEADLVEVARLGHPGNVRDAVRRCTDAFDGDGGARSDQAEYDRNEASSRSPFYRDAAEDPTRWT